MVCTKRSNSRTPCTLRRPSTRTTGAIPRRATVKRRSTFPRLPSRGADALVRLWSDTGSRENQRTVRVCDRDRKLAGLLVEYEAPHPSVLHPLGEEKTVVPLDVADWRTPLSVQRADEPLLDIDPPERVTLWQRGPLAGTLRHAIVGFGERAQHGHRAVERGGQDSRRSPAE